MVAGFKKLKDPSMKLQMVKTCHSPRTLEGLQQDPFRSLSLACL